MSNESGGGQGPSGGEHGHLTAGLAGGSSMFLTIGGAAAIVLTILGLANMYPGYMAAISVIAIGGVMALQGLALGSRYSRLVAETGTKHGASEIGGGLTAGFIAGAAGVALGILSLLGLDATVLTPIAVIVLGSGMLIGAGVPGRLAHFASQSSSSHPQLQHVVNEALSASSGADVLVGGGAVVLGIIALVGEIPLILTLVALLAMGTATLLTGTAIAGKIGGTWAHN